MHPVFRGTTRAASVCGNGSESTRRRFTTRLCYPGRGSSGDNPPRRECAPLWLDSLLARLDNIQLTLLIGQYAQRHFLGERRKASLTDTVRAWEEYAPAFVPLPHPSPRNQAWFKRHAWFDSEVLPMLRAKVEASLKEM